MPHSNHPDSLQAVGCDPLPQYILHNYFPLLTLTEKLAYKTIFAEAKAEDSGPALATMLRRSWVSREPTVQQLLARGPRAFFAAVRDRVLSDSASKVYLNCCPKCQTLARTPTACLCPVCNHTWYETREAHPKA